MKHAATRMTIATISLAVMVMATPGVARAYADPGSGAFVYQAAYAMFVGGAFYFRRILDRVWSRRK